MTYGVRRPRGLCFKGKGGLWLFNNVVAAGFIDLELTAIHTPNYVSQKGVQMSSNLN